MKLDFQNITVERSSAFQSQHFDIGNKRIILEILRGKMYSNPIQTIAQEISSNARDAHREVGKDHLPIEIKLPNKLEPWFWIRDFGPGITPERMADVFIKYGCSTKRNDNSQSGGWGLGAKSGFSYSDTFTVISITPEGSQLIRREYIAHIDESGLGQMTCVKEEETQDPQGTTVSLSPKEVDYPLFTEQVMRATVFWPVRPKILGARDWKWPEVQVEYKGNRWEIHRPTTYITGITAAPFAILDGIPYPIKGEHLFKTSKPEFSNFKAVALRLHFQTGELPITANREEIDYQDRSIQLLEERINAAFVELRTYLTLSVSQAPTLTKAIVAWSTAKKHQQFGHLITNTTWKSPKAAPTDSAIPLTTDLALKDIYCNLYWRANNEFGFTRTQERKVSTMHIDDTTIIVEDDSPTATVSRQRLANLFASLPNIKKLYLISFYRKTTIETVVSDAGIVSKKEKIIVDENSYAVNKKIAEMTCHWHYLDVLRLSDYEKKKIETTKTSSGPKVLTMRYIEAGSSLIRSDTFENLNADKTTIKYYLESSGNDFVFQKEIGSPPSPIRIQGQKGIEDVHLTYRDLMNALAQCGALAGNIRLHLVNTRHRPLLDANWIPLRNKVKEEVLKEAAKYGGILFKRRRSRVTDHFSEPFIKSFVQKLNLIKDQSCLVVKYFKDSSINLDSSVHACNLAVTFSIDVKTEGSDPMEDMFNQLKHQYPLLCSLQHHYGTDFSPVIADLISYVNIKNENLKKAP